MGTFSCLSPLRPRTKDAAHVRVDTRPSGTEGASPGPRSCLCRSQRSCGPGASPSEPRPRVRGRDSLAGLPAAEGTARAHGARRWEQGPRAPRPRLAFLGRTGGRARGWGGPQAPVPAVAGLSGLSEERLHLGTVPASPGVPVPGRPVPLHPQLPREGSLPLPHTANVHGVPTARPAERAPRTPVSKSGCGPRLSDPPPRKSLAARGQVSKRNDPNHFQQRAQTGLRCQQNPWEMPPQRGTPGPSGLSLHLDILGCQPAPSAPRPARLPLAVGRPRPPWLLRWAGGPGPVEGAPGRLAWGWAPAALSSWCWGWAPSQPWFPWGQPLSPGPLDAACPPGRHSGDVAARGACQLEVSLAPASSPTGLQLAKYLGLRVISPLPSVSRPGPGRGRVGAAERAQLGLPPSSALGSHADLLAAAWGDPHPVAGTAGAD